MPDEKEVTMVVIADTHCGSRAAICMPDNAQKDGGSYRAGSAQRALYEAWAGLAGEWHKPDILLHVGDAIEGQARKESGVGCWSTGLDDQLKCAALLIKEFDAKKKYIIEGTGYHVDAGGKSLEHWLGEMIGAEKIGSGNSMHAADELLLKVGKLLFHASHHISVGSGWYKTTPIAKEMVMGLLNASSKLPKGENVDVFLRAHVHTFCGVEFDRQRGFLVPCWQLQTKYMRKKSAFGMMPTIGALRFVVKGDVLTVQKRKFNPAAARPTIFKYEETNQQ